MATWAGLDSPGTPPGGMRWLKTHVLAGGMLSLSNQSQPEELHEDRITRIQSHVKHFSMCSPASF